MPVFSGFCTKRVYPARIEKIQENMSDFEHSVKLYVLDVFEDEFRNELCDVANAVDTETPRTRVIGKAIAGLAAVRTLRQHVLSHGSAGTEGDQPEQEIASATDRTRPRQVVSELSHSQRRIFRVTQHLLQSKGFEEPGLAAFLEENMGTRSASRRASVTITRAPRSQPVSRLCVTDAGKRYGLKLKSPGDTAGDHTLFVSGRLYRFLARMRREQVVKQ